MNIYNLRYFVTLARIRQYTKAAEELCITQPSLSHAISQMEKEPIQRRNHHIRQHLFLCRKNTKMWMYRHGQLN